MGGKSGSKAIEPEPSYFKQFFNQVHYFFNTHVVKKMTNYYVIPYHQQPKEPNYTLLCTKKLANERIFTTLIR